MPPAPLRRHVSLVATPDAQVSPLSGLFEVLNAFGLLSGLEPDVPPQPFEVEIVASSAEDAVGASGLPLGAHRTHHEIERTDIVVVPLMMVRGVDWVRGRYPELVAWLRRMHGAGARVCSTCTGVLLLAETGLLDGREATIHWAFAPTFRRNFPQVKLRCEEVLVAAGARQELVMTGGVTSWHDLALYLIATYVGPTAARSMARLMMLQWHAEGQAPYVAFAPPADHGDGEVRALQEWLRTHFAVQNPVDEMVRRSGLPSRSLERRFRKATSSSPIAYVQSLRIEEAKRRLERTRAPVDEISAAVGYENAAFFRRLFKRKTRLTPAAYRRKFALHGVVASA